jgi:hypothetical protein
MPSAPQPVPPTKASETPPQTRGVYPTPARGVTPKTSQPTTTTASLTTTERECREQGGTWSTSYYDPELKRNVGTCKLPHSPSGSTPPPSSSSTPTPTTIKAPAEARKTISFRLKNIWGPFIAHLARHAGLDATAVERVLTSNEYLDVLSWSRGIAIKPSGASFTTAVVQNLARQQGLNPQKALQFFQSADLKLATKMLLRDPPLAASANEGIPPGFGSLNYIPKMTATTTTTPPQVQAPAARPVPTSTVAVRPQRRVPLAQFISSQMSAIKSMGGEANIGFKADTVNEIVTSVHMRDFGTKLEEIANSCSGAVCDSRATIAAEDFVKRHGSTWWVNQERLKVFLVNLFKMWKNAS